MNATAGRAMKRASTTDQSQDTGGFLTRRQGWLRIGSVIGIIVGLFLIMQTLPVGAGIQRLEVWIDSLGVWGPIAFGALYVAAAVLFVPGLAITLAAGAMFGVVRGSIIVSLASTTAAAVSFLIARFVARNTVREQTRRYPKFRAVDRAIGEGGAKIVLLLRLVPAFPFSIGNYLLGLTPVRFRSYVLASWIGMMPATVVYVYLGHVGRAGVEAATTGTSAGRNPLEWALLAIGAAAALAVSIVITRLARRKLAEQTAIEPDDAADSREGAGANDGQQTSSPMWRTVAPACAAIVLLTLGAGAQLNREWWRGLLGTHAPVMTEAHESDSDSPAFDHAILDRILRTYVGNGGMVDYAALLEQDREALHTYIEQLGDADFDSLERDEKLALLINAYNAFTLELILEHFNDGALKSINEIPRRRRWIDVRWRVGGRTVSLDQIEHEEIRPKFNEPRIHWALVCAAVGCPPLRAEAYNGARIDEQLDDQARIVHRNHLWFRYDRDAGVVHLTKLYDWYGGDFEQVDGGILEHAARYVPELRGDLDAGRRPRTRWIDYDWNLNRRDTQP